MVPFLHSHQSHSEGCQVTHRIRISTVSLRAVSEAPTSDDLVSRGAIYGRFGYSDLKEAALRDYGICMRLSRFDWLLRAPNPTGCATNTNGRSEVEAWS